MTKANARPVDPEKYGAHRIALHLASVAQGCVEPVGRLAAARVRTLPRRGRHAALLAAVSDSMFAHFLRTPALVGGIVPSSPVLARTMSRQAAGCEAIVELGSGTGAVTRALAREHPQAALTVIEREPTLARRIGAACPHARVRIGCVHERSDVVLAQPRRAAAVSSLPFRSLPEEVSAATIAVLEQFLLAHEERRLVQYSYGMRAPFAFREARIRWTRVARVWRNVPPALVWVAQVQR